MKRGHFFKERANVCTLIQGSEFMLFNHNLHIKKLILLFRLLRLRFREKLLVNQEKIVAPNSTDGRALIEILKIFMSKICVRVFYQKIFIKY